MNIATDEMIAELTTQILAATDTAAQGRGQYLKFLVANTQQQLGLHVRVKPGKIARLSQEGIATQVAALTAVHDKFYAVVVQVATARGAKAGKELNSRTNFARTALYSLRVWLKAGNDIAGLAPARVSKATLAVVGRKLVKPPSAHILTKRVEKQSKALVAAFLGLIDVDIAAAAHELHLLMAQLTDQLGAITGKVTTSAEQAVAEGRPLKIKGEVFLPTRTQVIPAGSPMTTKALVGHLSREAA